VWRYSLLPLRERAQPEALYNYTETREAAEAALTVVEAAQGLEAIGHAVSISQSDLSVWCYACAGYVQHPRLERIRARMKMLKL